MTSERKKNCKILFSDLDGTLLNDKKEIKADTRDAITQMLAQGHIFAICTGRPLASAKKVAEQFQLNKEGCYMIAYNGGVIYDPKADHVISYASIPLPIVQRMFQNAKEAGVYIQTYDHVDDTILTYRHTAELDAYRKHTKMPVKFIQDISKELTAAPAKFMVISLKNFERLQQFREQNAEWSKDILNSFFSCQQYLEYCPVGVSKGTAVEKLCRYLDIPMEASIAIGDERNDISMLKVAGIGAAPANAFCEAAAVADYQCVKDNNEGAVGEIIQKYILEDTHRT